MPRAAADDGENDIGTNSKNGPLGSPKGGDSGNANQTAQQPGLIRDPATGFCFRLKRFYNPLRDLNLAFQRWAVLGWAGLC